MSNSKLTIFLFALDVNKLILTKPIHLIPKWQKIHYSFVSLLIGPCCLDPINRIQRNIWGPVNMETKEKCVFRHFGIRCMACTNFLHITNLHNFKSNSMCNLKPVTNARRKIRNFDSKEFLTSYSHIAFIHYVT